MESKEVLGSFDCLNKNALLGAALRSTGLIINEKLRRAMVEKMNKVVLLSMLYVRKKYYFYKYHRLTRSNGDYKKWARLFNSKGFFWYSLFNEENDFGDVNEKYDKKDNIEPEHTQEEPPNKKKSQKPEPAPKPPKKTAKKKETFGGRLIIKVLHNHFYSESEPFKLNAKKLRKYTINPDTTDKLLEFCSEQNKMVEEGGEDIYSFINKRSTHKNFEKIFAAEAPIEFIKDFNRKVNGQALIAQLQRNNIHKINQSLNTNFTEAQYDEAMEALKTSNPLPYPRDVFDIPEETERLFEREYITRGICEKFGGHENEVKIEETYRDLPELALLCRYYREWQKLKNLPHKSILSNVSDNEIKYDGHFATLEELQQVIDDLNFNSPLIKTDIKRAMVTHFNDLFINGLFFYRNYLKLRDSGNDTKQRLSPELFDNCVKMREDKGGVRTYNNYWGVRDKAIEDAEFEHVPWLRKILLKGDSVIDVFIDDEDDGVPIHELFKFVMCYNMGNKVFKQLSGYIDGQLPKESVPLGEVREDGTILTASEETGAEAFRLYKPEFGVNSLATKRWKAGIQTWTQGSDAFRLVEAEDNHVAVYFDISQAEVRVAAFMSGDEKMMEMYNNGVDLYIEMSKKAFPKQKDPSFHKAQRQTFKAVVLGVLYGRGGKSVSEALGITVEEAYRLIKTFQTMFPTLNKWIEKKKVFCRDHDGRIDTILGDRLVSPAGKSMTTGINWVIQSFAATMLAEGFFNLYYQSYKDKTYVIPKVVVHDSITVTTHAKNFFTTLKNINRYFKQYILDKYGIPLKYDMLTMKNFRDKCEFKWNEDTQMLEISGSETGVDAWVRTMNQHYKFKLVDESIEEVNEVKVLEKMISDSQIETFAYYPERDYIVPNKINRTYKITAR